MAANYSFALDLDLRPMSIKTVGTRPISVFQFEATDGTQWIATADDGSARVSLFQIAGIDGIVYDQATITANPLITKTVGTRPFSVFQFEATDGTRWIATADNGSNSVSLFQIAGIDGIVYDQATITANPLITKTVGTQPYSIFQFEATDGTRWIATADNNSARVSLFQIAGVDGIVYDQATITANALITKTVGSSPRSVFQFEATNGTRWIATADFGSARVSLFQIAGIDGIVDDEATITANPLITKTVGTQPHSVFQFQATDGTRWIATADFSSNRVSLFQIAGIDGIVDDEATITANALITKTVGSRPVSVFQFEATDGARWIATADNVSARVSLFQIAGVDGIVDDQATITANPLITKTVGTQPYSIFQFEATDGTRWIATADFGSNRVSLFQIAGVDGGQLLPNSLTNVVVSLSTKLITAENLAEVTSSLDYFNFAAGVAPVAFSFLFAYTFDFDDSGTIGSGSTLRLTTATADITNSSGITVASGATVRLGKKATYTIDFFFENGSTLEVFPNADRSGVDLDLTNCTFAATTTINVTSGTATVLVLSTAGITAGAGVTLSAPVSSYTATGLDNGTSLYLAHQQSFVVASSAVNTGLDTITLGNDSNSQPPAFASSSPYTNVKIQATAGATLPTTSPQIVDGGRYYATISSGAITLFVKESDIAGTPITISTTGTNASGSIFTLIAETELSNTEISGGSGASIVLTLANGDRVVRKAIYWASSAGVATATPLYIQEFLWSATAGINDPVVVDTAIELNEVHEDIVASTSVQLGGRIKDASGTVVTELTAANDGSTLDASNGGPYSFGLEGGGGRVQVNASDADGLSLWQDLYIWGVWVSSTPAGIRLINADTSSAIRSNTFVFANFEIDNISSTRLNIVGGNGTSVDGSSLVAPIQTGSGGINLNALSLGTLLVFESGTSGLTAGEAEDLADLAATLQTAGVFSAAALANAPSGGGGGLTAQQVRDALTLAPTAGSPAAGSVDADLDTLVARNNALDAAGTRSAVGLGSANLDTQLGAIDTVVDAILVDTDATIPAQITDRTLAAANYFDPATDTVANVTTVSTVTDKSGYSLTTPPLDSTATQAAAAAALNAYDPPTRAELTSDIGVVTGAIDGLNDLSAAQVNAEVDVALADYDGPTKTELDSAVAGLATSSALATVDAVVDAILEDTETTIPALIADVPTVAEFEARTIPAADYFVVSDYTAPANSDIAAIKAKTDNLPSDPADQSQVEGAITAATSGLATTANITALNNLSAAQVNAEVDTALADVGLTPTVTGRIDAAISSRLATAGYTAPSNSDITAIKAKTDNLPSDPADQSAVEAAITAAQSAILAGGFTSSDRNILIAAEAAARAVASGRHKIDYAASTATQYNADGSVRTVFDLVDADGNPATTGATAVERVPQ